MQRRVDNTPRGTSVPESSLLGLRAELERARGARTGDARGTPAHVRPRPSRQARSSLRLSDSFVTPRKRNASRESDSVALDASRAALERKAQTYAKLARGRHGGISERDRGEVLVDWDAKEDADVERGAGDGDPADASASAAADDPVVEYTDEFGRTREARLSDVPRAYLPMRPEDDDEEYDNAIYGPASEFPVYHREEAPRRVSPPPVHFDADWEVRSRGAGFYRFAQDESQRREQQASLAELRSETEIRRSGTEDTSSGG
ncbi:hypothetical protein MSPP1_003689 [Malassezia sp. CBS 17886]|nr:hypothetical protein MSPP1_003689 [Malassezia sp. CBS 17886]